MDYEIFELGDVKLQSGGVLRGAKMAYKTYGTLNAAKDNVIVYPCWYSGTHLENEWLISPVMALDSRANTPLLVMAPGDSKLCLRVAESVAFRKSGLPLETAETFIHGSTVAINTAISFARKRSSASGRVCS